MSLAEKAKQTGKQLIVKIIPHTPDFAVHIKDPERIGQIANTMANQILDSKTFRRPADKKAAIEALSVEINADPEAFINSTTAHISRGLDNLEHGPLGKFLDWALGENPSKR